MALKELVEPIYDIQEGEKPKQYYFLTLFFAFDGNLEEYISWMEHGCVMDSGGSLELKYKPYKPNTIRDLCSKNQWLSRRDAKHVADIERRQKQVDRIEDKRFIERYELKEDNEYLALKRMNKDLKYNDRYTGGQFKDSTQGIRNLQDSRNIDRGEPTERTINQHNIEGTLDSNVDVRHHSVAEDIILNPAYAELTRKLLEDVTNEEGTDSK